MPIEDLARREVVTASADTAVTDLASTMKEHSVGSVVITEEVTPTGIVTDRDLTVRVLAEEADPEGLTAADVMTDDLCTIEEGSGFYTACELMNRHGVRRLPVCDDGELVGIITGDDFTELLADEHQQFAEVIRAQRPPY